MRHATRTLLTTLLVAGMMFSGVVVGQGSPVRASESVTCDGMVIGGPERANIDNDVLVVLYRLEGSDTVYYSQTSPVDGRYEFTGVPTGNSYVIAVEHNPASVNPELTWKLPQYCGGVYTREEGIAFPFTPGGNFGCDFNLVHNPAIGGTVTRSDGATPIEGARVILDWRLDPTKTMITQTAVTDAAGRYSFYAPEPGEFRVWFGGDGWAGEWYDNVIRSADAPWMSAGALSNVNAALDQAVGFTVDRAYSPFGTRLPAEWNAPSAGLPYEIMIFRRVSAEGVTPAEWEPWHTVPAGSSDFWPNSLPGGTYVVKFNPPAGTYRARYHINSATLAGAQVVTANPGETIAVYARFGGYVKAATTIAATANVVRSGATVRLTTIIRDASTPGRTAIPQAGAPFRLQRSYNGRTWTNVGTIRRTGATGRYVTSVRVTRTAYYRAVPVNSTTLRGTASRAVRVRVR